MDTIVINPSSIEVNRGSYCYDPYLFAAATGAEIIEEASVEYLDREGLLDVKANWIVGLWSYPQIDFAQSANINLRGWVRFVGYKPLIEKLGFEVADFDLERGLERYPHHYSRFENILLSDCDLHIQSEDDPRQVFPLFLGYGCTYNCTFCATSVNHRKITLVSKAIAQKNVSYVGNSGNIHFTDESFFLKPSSYLDVVYEAMDGSFKWIALTSARDLRRELDRVGANFLKSKGFVLAEVGYESHYGTIRDAMQKKDDMSDVEAVIACGIPVLWLTVTFFPGETIKSITETGDFLWKYGFNKNEVLPRIVTNSTGGGLGQYFQPYTGTSVNLDGVMLTDRPIRLVPSFIPNSFLDEMPELISDVLSSSDFAFWLSAYNLPTYNSDTMFQPGRTVRQIIASDPIRLSVYVALAARFGAIRSSGQRRDPTEFRTYPWRY